jgi:hypothetical protein
MTILFFPSAPINGGTFDLSPSNSNFGVCQLTPNKFLAVYRQNSPSFTLAQVVNIIDKNTVTFGNIWVVNSINVTTSVVVKKIKGTTDKALLICADEPAKTLYTQILTVDSNDDISASPFSTFIESDGTQINLMNIISFDSFNNRMVINYNYISSNNYFRSRKILIDTTSNTATILGSNIFFSGETNEFYGSYQDDIDSSNNQYCVILKSGGTYISKFTVLRRTFTGLNSTTSYGSVTTTTLKNDISTQTIYSISNVLKLGNFLYFTITGSSYDVLCEFNLNTNTETLYTLTGSRYLLNLEKIDDYHYIEVQNNVSGNPIGTNMKMRVLRLLIPGILESPLNPITVLPSQTGTFRNNYRVQSSTPTVYFTNLNKNTFLINSNLFCYFYKTNQNYRVALLYN